MLIDMLILSGCIVTAVLVAILNGRRSQKSFLDSLEDDSE
jgi:hypothetical protein